jgi:hypothetical protein
VQIYGKTKEAFEWPEDQVKKFCSVLSNLSDLIRFSAQTVGTNVDKKPYRPFQGKLFILKSCSKT